MSDDDATRQQHVADVFTRAIALAVKGKTAIMDTRAEQESIVVDTLIDGGRVLFSIDDKGFIFGPGGAIRGGTINDAGVEQRLPKAPLGTEAAN